MKNNNKKIPWFSYLVIILLALFGGTGAITNMESSSYEEVPEAIVVEQEEPQSQVLLAEEEQNFEQESEQYRNQSLAQDEANETHLLEQEISQNTDYKKQYRFRNERLLKEHFEKHGKEMGFDSPESYVAAANEVINHENVLHKIEAEDEDDVYYLEENNGFVVVSVDGYIRTFYYPEDGIEYFNRQ